MADLLTVYRPLCCACTSDEFFAKMARKGIGPSGYAIGDRALRLRDRG